MNKDLSYFGLGTAAIGRPQYINIKKGPSTPFNLTEFKNRGVDTLNTAYDEGVRYYDTAPGYGLAEELLLEWQKRKNNENIEVATKWGYTYVADFNPNAAVHEVKEHSVQKLNEQWEVSKSLLPNLTYYQIHSATLETGVLRNEAVLSKLAHLKEKYNIGIGVSISGANQAEIFKKAIEIERNGNRLFDLIQVTYNVFDQSLREIIHKNRDLKIVVKEAMANGRVFPNSNYPHYSKAYRLLEELADKYGVGIDAIALRFGVESIPVFKVLSGASSKEHLSSNLKAAEIKLEDDDIQKLQELEVPPDQYWAERKKLSWH